MLIPGEFLSTLYSHTRRRKYSRARAVCPNICVCAFMGGLCSEDDHCNLDHSRGNRSSPGVVWLSQESMLDRLALEKVPML